MIDKLIALSVRHKVVVLLFVAGLVGWGTYSLTQVSIDAVPDITNNQVQVITNSPDLAAIEVEQFITYPLERHLANVPGVVELRSVSRSGISVVTVVFEEDLDIYLARQLVSEQLMVAREEIPEDAGSPYLAPISTGLSEIYQYVLEVDPEVEEEYSDMDLRTIQDWIVKRQMAGIKGVVEISSFGGHLKQYEVSIDPDILRSYNLSITEVYTALQENNQNAGGAYIEKNHYAYYIRSEGMVKNLDELEQVVIKNVEGVPLRVGDVAEVKFGYAPRFGAITRDGEETVGGIVLMLKGANSDAVIDRVKERIAQVQKSLPEGVSIQPYLDRSELVSRTIKTVTTNLIEGGLIVILVLVLLLGHLRAGLIVASVIPLAMLFALGMMNVFDVSANLMSLGAIDFGLIVDGSVIVVEAILHQIYTKYPGRSLSREQMNNEVTGASIRIRKSAAFGEIIILIVYLPILTLRGIEGKMFIPMAQVVGFAILGALILSLTYVPMISSLALKRKVTPKKTIADKIMNFLHKIYDPVIKGALRVKALVISAAVALFIGCLFLFNTLGGEFIPTLEEGDFAVHQMMPPGTSLEESVQTSYKIQEILETQFPEVEDVVTKIGSAEIPTDPMPMELGDIIVKMKPKEEWVTAHTMDGMFEKMEEALSVVPGVAYEFTQPIQMRFNELMTGVREELAIKIYGDDLDVLFESANDAAQIIRGIPGAADVKVEQVTGQPQLFVRIDRSSLSRYGASVESVNSTIRSAYAGAKAGSIYEGERRFDLVIRMKESLRKDLENLREMFVPLPNGEEVPLKELAEVSIEDAPAQVSHEASRRRIAIGVNPRNIDIETLVAQIQVALDEQLNLPPGYAISYGGQFENLEQAKERLTIAVPLALFLIFILLFFTFRSVRQAIIIFMAVPMAAIGGVVALWLRDMPFSISAGVGFIALFGVAVLNGIVLISYFNDLKKEGMELYERIIEGVHVRLRPVILTASVASLGFLPMAMSASAGAEVQRPLATVVIGGLITATLLTLVVIPVLYYYSEKIKIGKTPAAVLVLLLLIPFTNLRAQDTEPSPEAVDLDEALNLALENYPSLNIARMDVEQRDALEGTAWETQDTYIYFQREETNGEAASGVRTFGVQQTIDFPLTYLRRKQYLEQRTSVAESRLLLEQGTIKYQTLKAYSDLLVAREKLNLYTTLDSIYLKFREAAELQFSTGETNKVPYLNSAVQTAELRAASMRAAGDYESAQAQLERLTGRRVVPAADSIYLYSSIYPVDQDTADWQNNWQMAVSQAEVEAAEKNLKLQRSEFLPGITAGYGNQKVHGMSGYYIFQMGLRVPLIFAGKKAEVNAARIQTEQAKKRAELTALNLKSEKEQVQARMVAAHQSLLYYQEELLPLVEEQYDAAALTYRLGEVDFTTFFVSIQQGLRVRREYLDMVNNYNQLVSEYLFLTGNL